MSDATDVTFGARYFDREDIIDYYEEHPTGNLDADPNFANGITRMIGSTAEFVPKISVRHNLDDDSMVYGLWTVGYRPGGTNRQRGDAAFPQQYDADKMINYELGYKSSFADDTATLSLTAFAMQWDDYQFELIDPSFGPCDDETVDAIPGICGQPYQVGVFNAGDAHINGVNAEFDWNPTDNLSVGFNLEWLEAETDTVLELGYLYVEAGTKLPLTPDFTAGAWATYDWAVPSMNANGYARVQWSYSGSRLSSLEYTPFVNDDGSTNPYPSWNDPAYNIGDVSIGLQGDDWEVSMFLNNVTDERVYYGHASQGGYTQQNLDEGRMHVDTVYTNRPREYGIRFIRKFGS
jgi:outer membrane receptor for ferrienterochelin and colicin